MLASWPLVGVSVSQDVTTILPSNASEYLLKAGSSFDAVSVVVDAASFSFTMNPGDAVTLTARFAVAPGWRKMDF